MGILSLPKGILSLSKGILSLLKGILSLTMGILSLPKDRRWRVPVSTREACFDRLSAWRGKTCHWSAVGR